jgi:hypothetical protein
MALESLWLLILLVFLFGFFLHAHPKKWQNNQRIDGGRILVEVEVEGKKCKNHGSFPTEVSDMARNMKIELLTFSLALLMSRKTVDTEYTYYS